MPSIEPTGWGISEHGTVTVGLTAVLVQAFDTRLKEWTGYNAGPGIIYPGGSGVTIANSIPIDVGDFVSRENAGDDLYFISDQAATVIKFYRERSAA